MKIEKVDETLFAIFDDGHILVESPNREILEEMLKDEYKNGHDE